MKLKVLLGMLFVAGVAAALAVATPTRADSGTTGTTTTTTSSTTTSDKHHGRKKDDEHAEKHASTTTSTSTSTSAEHEKGDKPRCQKVELKGSNGSGTLALTVSKANHGGQTLVGKQVTLTIPAGATVKASACLDASGVLTLRELHVEAKHLSPTTTGTTTAAGTTTTTHS